MAGNSDVTAQRALAHRSREARRTALLDVAAIEASLQESGYAVVEGFISEEMARSIRSAVDACIARGDCVRVDRSNALGRQRFLTVNGSDAFAVPELMSLAHELRELMCAITRKSYVLAHVPEIALSVNVVDREGAFSAHYDRHELTAVLYLNSPVGGELELYPLYRRLWPGRAHHPIKLLQRATDLIGLMPWMRPLLGRRVRVSPRTGRLLLMWGTRTLHAVSPVSSGEPRYSVQFAYDLPHVRYDAAGLAQYYGNVRK